MDNPGRILRGGVNTVVALESSSESSGSATLLSWVCDRRDLAGVPDAVGV